MFHASGVGSVIHQGDQPGLSASHHSGPLYREFKPWFSTHWLQMPQQSILREIKVTMCTYPAQQLFCSFIVPSVQLSHQGAASNNLIATLGIMCLWLYAMNAYSISVW